MILNSPANQVIYEMPVQFYINVDKADYNQQTDDYDAISIIQVPIQIEIEESITEELRNMQDNETKNIHSIKEF